MSRELLILRHAKSSWASASLRDFDRPLAERGRRDALRMGRWLLRQDLLPDGIISSPARRARESVERVCEALALPVESVRWEERLYLADLAALLEILEGTPSSIRRLLLVGHNPGLDELLIHLCGAEVPRNAAGKSMTTAAIAHVALPDGWSHLPDRCGRLIQLVRPRELAEEG